MNLYDVVYESQGNWMETVTVEADSPEEAMAKANAAEDVVDVRYHAHDTQDRTYDRMEGGNPTPPLPTVGLAPHQLTAAQNASVQSYYNANSDGCLTLSEMYGRLRWEMGANGCVFLRWCNMTVGIDKSEVKQCQG